MCVQLLGLAIYNGVILDVHFPKVVYRRLLDAEPTLEDLEDALPVCHSLSESLCLHSLLYLCIVLLKPPSMVALLSGTN